MNKKRYFFAVLATSFCLMYAQQQRVGVNTQNPGETIYIENEKLGTLLDVNGNLRVRDIPDLSVNKAKFQDDNTYDVSKQFADRLYWDYTQGTVEVPGISTTSLEKPFFIIEYAITLDYLDGDNKYTGGYAEQQAWKGLVLRDFDTKINAKNFTMVVMECVPELQSVRERNDLKLGKCVDCKYQGVQHIGFYGNNISKTDMNNAIGFAYFENPSKSNINVNKKDYSVFNPVEYLDSFVKNGTWHISADFFQARPMYYQQTDRQPVYSWPYRYYIKVLAINNDYINRIRIPGKALSSQIKGIQTGGGENPSIPDIENPGRDVRSYQGIYEKEVPWGSVGENPLQDKWIIPNNKERDDNKHYEF